MKKIILILTSIVLLISAAYFIYSGGLQKTGVDKIFSTDSKTKKDMHFKWDDETKTLSSDEFSISIKSEYYFEKNFSYGSGDTSNRRIILFYYDFTNLSDEKLRPNDIWEKYFWLKQGETTLTHGENHIHDFINNGSDYLDSSDNGILFWSKNEKVSAAAMFTYRTDQTNILTAELKDNNDKIVGKFEINTEELTIGN